MRVFVTFLSLLISLSLFAQNATEELRQHTSEVYGIDDILVNGTEYRTLHPIASGDPFFETSACLKGTINLKGRSFQDVLLKYDIEQQILVLKGFADSARFEVIALNNNYVKSFWLKGRYFVNIESLLPHSLIKGFYELIYKGSFLFVRWYSKEFVASYSNRYPNGKYSKTKAENFLVRNGEKYRIKKKKDLYKLFPQQKASVKKFMKDNKIKLKKSSNQKLNNLMQYCDEVSTK